MKKLFLMLAAIVMMTACNGNGNTSSGSTSQEEKKVEALAENEYFKVMAVPDGWEVNKEFDSERGIEIKLKPGTDLGEWQNATVSYYNIADPQELVDQLMQDENRKLGDDVTIGDKTFKQVLYINSADYYCALVTKHPKGSLEVMLTEKLTPDNAAVKAIIEGIEYKN